MSQDCGSIRKEEDQKEYPVKSPMPSVKIPKGNEDKWHPGK